MNSFIEALEEAARLDLLIGSGGSAHLYDKDHIGNQHAPYFLLKGNFEFFQGSQHVTYDNKRIRINGFDNLLHPSNAKLLSEIDDQAHQLVRADRIGKLPGWNQGKRHTVLVDCAWAANYYHFMVDVFGKIMVASKFLELSDCLFVINSWQHFQREAFELAGLDVQWVGYDQLYVADMYIPSLPGSSNCAPCETYRFIKSIFSAAQSMEDCKYLYISRGKARRKILNERELVDELRKIAPFKLVELESMPFERQVALFKQAEIVLGSHGAGLVNCAHMINPRGVYEIFGVNYQSMQFKNLCHQMQIPYASFGVNSELMTKGQQGDWCDDYCIDIKSLIHEFSEFYSMI